MTVLSGHAFTTITKIDELDVIQVCHPLFSADIALQGAQLLTFQPSHDTPWIWLSPEAEYKTGQSLRGGIPICWPWFGVANKNPLPVSQQILPDTDTASSHGFARVLPWQITNIQESCHEVIITLNLKHSEDTLSVWPFEFDLSATFTLGRSLKVDLTTTNLSSKSIAVTQALHTYFPCRDIANASIEGTANVHATDALNDWQVITNQNNQRFDQEVDRIFHTGGPFAFHTGHQRLVLSSNNSQSTIVWNPWSDKAKRLGQYGDERYCEMFCVETANALDDMQWVEPDQSFTLSLELNKA